MYDFVLGHILAILGRMQPQGCGLDTPEPKGTAVIPISQKVNLRESR